ncbi:MATE family efflux transporter [Oribacterium sp. WCC10]|uniref:MATE family efflux transporter n=1 Tax=Oribacterium sp. WCC10 TaxID=1855343 RepID=UPI0008E77FC5|nr:MATE family efflux transporter [Oribacterium sp. WCC10]SFG45412.1 Na+-driven multidrug efflux pump [Oribacterium sp. WCC10]
MSRGIVIQESRIIRDTFYAQLMAFFLSELTHMLGNLIDGVIIGRCLGVDSMAAFGIVSPLMTCFALFGTVISTGSRNRFTRLIGEGKLKEAQGIFSLAITVTVGIATLLMLILIPFSAHIARVLGATGNASALLPKARAYLLGISFGLPAMNAMRILNGYYPIDNDRNLPVIASIVLTVTDVLMDFIVAFVIHGDTFGMGLATSISYYMALAVLLLHFRKKEAILRYSFKYIRLSELKGIVSQGIPVGVFRIGFTLRTAFMNRLLALVASSSAIAAYSVYQQADDILCSLTIGMADTVAIMAGILMGEEDRPRMKRLLFTSLQATLMITLGVAVFTWIFAPQFASLYIKEHSEALSLATVAVRSYAIGMPFYGLSLIYFNYFQGIGRSRLSSVSGFLSESGFLMLSAGLLSFRFKANAVWFAFPATQLLMYIYYVILINVKSRMMGIGDKGILDKILLLPDTFDVPEEDCIDLSTDSMKDVTRLTRAVWKFCEEHGCDTYRRYHMALAVEEMAGNIIEHGFSKDKRAHSIDVRVLKKGDDYILRIRDNCLIFDPVKQLEMYSENDIMHHPGIRIIIGLSKEFRYTCILKLNNLLVRI